MSVSLAKYRRILVVTLLCLFALSIFVLSSAKCSSENTLVKRVMFEGSGTVSTIAAEADLYMCHIEQGYKEPLIKAKNPNVIALLYRNIRTVYKYAEENQMFKDNGWMLKDPNGNYILSTVFGYLIVDVGNAQYQTWVANWIKAGIAKYGFDGAFLDNCLPSSEIMWSTSPTPAINPRTRQAFTSQEFKQAVISLVNKIKATITPNLVIGNSIYNGERFFSTYRNQDYVDLLKTSKIDGVESEMWLMDCDQKQWYSESKWKANVDFAVWLENNFLGGDNKFLPVCQNLKPYDGGGARLPSGCTAESIFVLLLQHIASSRDKKQHSLLKLWLLPQHLLGHAIQNRRGNTNKLLLHDIWNPRLHKRLHKSKNTGESNNHNLYSTTNRDIPNNRRNNSNNQNNTRTTHRNNTQKISNRNRSLHTDYHIFCKWIRDWKLQRMERKICCHRRNCSCGQHGTS